MNDFEDFLASLLLFLVIWAVLTSACAGVWLISQTTYPFWRTVGGASLICALIAFAVTVATAERK